jgi:hypothetical protein
MGSVRVLGSGASTGVRAERVSATLEVDGASFAELELDAAVAFWGGVGAELVSVGVLALWAAAASS